jgi:type IV fimbrial biogenesis protein FimT
MQALAHRRKSTAAAPRGVSLIELLVGIAILAIAIAIGAPSFAEWINNSQIRSTAESVQSGLQFARSEAVRRNAVVRMQLTTTVDNGCAVDKNGTNWVVNMSASTSPATKCGADVSDINSPFLLQKGTSVSSKASATVSGSQAVVAFNGLGRVVDTTNPTTAIGTSTINIKSSRGACAADPIGTLRCLRVVVTPGGQIRMCDPKRTDTTDPMVCP